MNCDIFPNKWLLSACSILLLNSCYDDTLRLYEDNLTEGEVLVSFDANFEPFAEADLTRSVSGGAAGDVLKDLDDLCLILYDKNGVIVSGYPKEVSLTSVEDVDRNDGDGAYTGAIAEAKTKHATFNATIPVGDYYIIGVANLGNGSKESASTLDYLNSHSSEIQTLHGLRNMRMTWDYAQGNIGNNDQMLGYFDMADIHESPNANSHFSLVGIHSSGITLKTWLRRCASKITVDFDGSALRDNVYVYIKDVKIKNIPADCTLGFGKENEANSSTVTYDYNNVAGIHEGNSTFASLLDENHNSQVITFGEGTEFNEWPCITNGSPYLMENEKNSDGSETSVKMDLHSETSQALFFFENMQGRSPHPKVSTADPSTGKPEGSGNSSYDYDGVYALDGVPAGTYIEVTAHYISTNYDNVGDSDIKYRFMIGKDAIDNCDAERNSHFKLTLKLRGNANDYDWHVDYHEEEGFDAPNPWYVSYVYNHSSMMPFKYTPPAGYKVVKIEAEIIENPWYPTFKNGKPDVPGGDSDAPYFDDSNRKLGNGFLALRSPMSEENMTFNDGTLVTDVEASGKTFEGGGRYNGITPDYNDNFFYGKSPSASQIDKSTRTYYFDGTSDLTNKQNDSYTYRLEKDARTGVDKYIFNIPLFTRQKVLVKETGYSGNNPFVAKTRTAKLQLSATIVPEAGGAEEVVSKVIDVIQVKRLVNPKGVYRRAGNNQDFHVILMERNDISEDEFHKTVSDGPWRAEIIGDNNFITLDGKQNISGATRTNIDFTIKFNKTNGKSMPNKNAIVRILYNNYTCTHLIFVRQGYDAQALSVYGFNSDSNTSDDQEPTKWSTFNLIADGLEASDPRDEGSLFKFGNISTPIDVINNVYDGDQYGDGDVFLRGFNSFSAPNAFQIVGTDGNIKMKNGEKDLIAWDADGFKSDDKGFVNTNSNVASIRDFEQLYLTQNLQTGYGVLYADGATTTQTKTVDIFGYNRRSPSTKDNGESIRGMRGVFVYNYNVNNPSAPCTGRNVFFPIGRSAYGHRKDKDGPDKVAGVLRYSCANNSVDSRKNSFSSKAPLFVSLLRREGAIYWAREKSDNYLTWNKSQGTGYAYALDLNYFSFDVNSIGNSDINNGADACFIRCVAK